MGGKKSKNLPKELLPQEHDEQKSLFVWAELVAKNVSIRNSGRDALAQIGSRIWLDGVEVEPEPLDVEALYEIGGSGR